MLAILNDKRACEKLIDEINKSNVVLYQFHIHRIQSFFPILQLE